jgi:uncharacterized membrane protein
MSARLVARGAIYVLLYWALTMLSGMVGLASGAVQFRLSEALLAFACVDPAAIVGLTLGTAVGNASTSGMGVIDIVAGALLTLVAALVMHRIGPRVVALAAPVAVNAVGVGLMLWLILDVPLWLGVGGVALGEAVVMFTAGLGCLSWVRRHGDLIGLHPAAGAARDSRTTDKDG